MESRMLTLKLPVAKVELSLIVYVPASKVSPSGEKLLLGKVSVLLAVPSRLVFLRLFRLV